MSSVPMIGSGSVAGISLLGCNAESQDEASPQVETRKLHGTHSNDSSSFKSGPGLTSDFVLQNEKAVHRLPPNDTSTAAPNGNEQSDRKGREHSQPPLARPGVCPKTNGTSHGHRSIDLQSDAKQKGSSTESGNDTESSESACLHRVREVRVQQGLSVRSIARRLGIDAKAYKRIEDSSHDLTISELRAIQSALDVPFVDLLVDRNSLSQPVKERAKLVKVMKSAVAIRQAKSSPRIQRLADMLCEQLTDLMPELAEVSGWPQFGARRGQSAVGKALREPIDTSQLGLSE